MGNLTLLGNPINVLGQVPAIGSKATDFQLLDGGLAEKTLADFPGKKVIYAIPSFDTDPCSTGLRWFEKNAAKFSDYSVIIVSMDLPFAIKRWCDAEKTSKIIGLSDYRRHSFGKDYGVLIEGLELLSRAVFVLDSDNKVSYFQRPNEVGDQLDNDALLAAVSSVHVH